VQAGIAECQPAPKTKTNNQTAGMAPACDINNYNYCTLTHSLSTLLVMPARINIAPFPLMSRVKEGNQSEKSQGSSVMIVAMKARPEKSICQGRVFAYSLLSKGFL